MDKWEYKVLSVGNGNNEVSYGNLEKVLNELGENNWEVVGTFSPVVAPGCHYSADIILKRQKS